MSLDFGDSRLRRITGGLIGLLLSAPAFINSSSVLEFIGFTILGVLVAGLTTEICFHIWRRIRKDNVYLKIFASIVGLSVIALILYLTVFFSWVVFAGNSYNCLMDIQKPVENKFTGECKTVQVCGTTSWYYKEGCSSEDVEASSSCLMSIKGACATQEERIEKPSVCTNQKLPDKYRIQNGSIRCPS